MKGRRHIHHSKNFQNYTIGELKKMPVAEVFRLFFQDISSNYKSKTRKEKKEGVIFVQTKHPSDPNMSLEEKVSYLISELSTQSQISHSPNEINGFSSQAAGEVIKRKRGRPRKHNLVELYEKVRTSFLLKR